MSLPIVHAHEWDVSTAEARTIQEQLASKVQTTHLDETYDRPVRTIAGIDVSIRGGIAQAAVSVLELPDLSVAAESVHRCDIPFPYVPGYLSFREMPAILPALDQLAQDMGALPDVLVTDSQGRAHPRRFGLACHLGVVLNHPSFGVAKSILTGEPLGTLSTEKGSTVPLVDGDEQVGVALRTRANVNPVYVSIGHRITLEEAIDLTLRVSPRYKIPETTRHAHRLSRQET
ncbi:endonuclease V [Longibacter salinarum]|uniref:Endonuclease V n=1 Tax=Longibacter salinarum TaxID=1850348 RepID=A0A2A8CUP6_9BACT|nr:endonuclease V [Longibacter salinarum]PEN11271.1 endonuclease V [Longibacter salinarum]